jgi:hypothetical protein
MRIQTSFVILLVLLILCRVGNLCSATSHYVVARGLLSLKPIPGTTEDAATTAALMEQKKDALENGIQTCVEVMMLAGVGACFFVVLRRSKAPPTGMPA